MVVERATADDPQGFYVGDAFVRRACGDDGAELAPVMFGGMYNTLLREWEGPSEDPAVWYCGREQLAPVMHGAADGTGRYVCVGSAGSGKSEVGAMFAARRTILTPGKAFGCVAPTGKRLKVCWEKMVTRLRPAWVDHEQTRKMEELVLVNGRRFQFAAAKEYSSAYGSPLQGYTWDIGMWIDEEQDITDQSMADAMMRGRNARGVSFCLSTCTLKRDPSFRTRRDKYAGQEGTIVQPMTLHGSPFESLEHLAQLKRELPPDMYTMLVLARDAPPERAIYSMFDRNRHLRPWPKVGARDIAAELTATRALPNGVPWIIAHDPGTLWDVSLGLKAFAVPWIEEPVWWVMWEVSTRKKVLDAHIAEVTAVLRERGAKSALVVADPYAKYASDNRVNVESYKLWKRAGFLIRPAAYSKTNPSAPGKVPKREGIDMVRMLLRNAADETRLYVDCDDTTRTPSAPRLVGALESMEYSESGDPETEKKDSKDVSHWPASLRYGLWPWERVRIARARLKARR